VPEPIFLDRSSIATMLTVHGLLPSMDGSHFGADKSRNSALKTLYETCGIIH
jgi:hypothetical protein